MAADRAQHVATEIEPALERGDWVVCDRYVPSSLVYQGVVRGLGVEQSPRSAPSPPQGLTPDVVLVLDVDDDDRGRASGSPTRPARARRRRRSTPRCARAYRELARSAAGSWSTRDGTVDEVAGRVRDARRASCWQDDGTVASRACGPGSSGRTGRWRSCSAPPSGPVHAYLLVGPRGSGVEEAARCFAAAVVAPDGDERAWDLVLRGVHPDVVEIDPPANQIRIGGRAADHRRGVAQPDRGRAQGDHPLRRRAAPAQRRRGQQAAEDARGTAADVR